MKQYLQFILFCLALFIVGFMCGTISNDMPVIGYLLAFVFFVLLSFSTASVMKTYNTLSRPENYSDSLEHYNIEKQIENGDPIEETKDINNVLNDEYPVKKENE